MKTDLSGFEAELADLKEKDLFRTLRHITKRQGKNIFLEDIPYLNLSSNDYLGLATQTDLLEEFYSRKTLENLVDQFGPGSSSSRLLIGNFDLYSKMESLLCDLYDSSSALVFNSGYHANIGIIPVLAGKEDLIVSDSLNHASIVDGVRLSRADCLIFEHNRTDELEKILIKNRDKYQNVLIIAESVFSMDGDLADIAALVELKNKYNALLYVDEAHSIGIYGFSGLGLCHELGLHDQVDILLCPMGKALASHGSYVITSRVLGELLVNRMRSLLYTTALPPVAMNWNRFVMDRLARFSKKRNSLHRVSAYLRQQLDRLGIEYTGESHIIPVLVGQSAVAVDLARHLQENGFLVFPIRFPTVPQNQARIRISLTSDITEQDLEPLPELIHAFLRENG